MKTEMSPLKVGCGKFFHGRGAIQYLPGEIRRLGGKALIIGGRTSLEHFWDCAGPLFQADGTPYVTLTHTGSCTADRAMEFVNIAKENTCNVLVAVGGGKCIDNVKCASVFSGLPVITVPASIATCAATSMVAIMYNEKGQRSPAVNLKKEVDVCIADHDLIATAPRRTLAAGILDSMAKYPESLHKKQVTGYQSCDLKEYIQIINAKAIYEFLSGEYEDLYRNNGSAGRFDDAILTNLLHTSIVSGFADGSGQLAVAHATYDFIRNYHTSKGSAFLHGELVAIGLLIQMAFNRCPASEIDQIRRIMREMDMPLTLNEIGYDTSKESLDFFTKHLAADSDITSEAEILRLNNAVLEAL
ncbi:iron-containing alcohol dehydrogenase [Diplocloster hominis]|uniref:iron-containing alcohol dehydrogenase n=1 Tax=Diplocloster hominis TaxID=3079010 RepID=UPI0031BACDAF